MNIPLKKFKLEVSRGNIKMLYMHVLGMKMLEVIPEGLREEWVAIQIDGMDAIEAFQYFTENTFHIKYLFQSPYYSFYKFKVSGNLMLADRRTNQGIIRYYIFPMQMKNFVRPTL